MRVIQLLMIATASAALIAGCGGGGGSSAPAPAPSPAPALVAALDAAKAFLASYDTNLATAPASTVSGATVYSLNDACYLNNGYTHALNVSLFDANKAVSLASSAYAIGSTRSNVQVLAERNTTNADGSARREIDVSYTINYADGSVDNINTQTLISGSSSGSCATPQTGTNFRFFGNRHLVGVTVRARNIFTASNSITTDLRLNNTSRREVQFLVNDPSGNATYAVVTASAGSTTVTGVAVPLSFKMLSPRIMRDPAQFGGIPGNYTNFKDEDYFWFCRTGLNTVSGQASGADCKTYGAGGTSWGSTASLGSAPYAVTTTVAGTATVLTAAAASAIATSDTNFSNFGFLPNTTFTFAIYNDTGWQGLNGHLGKTPIATYTATFDKLPYTQAEMVTNAGVRYPLVTSTSLAQAPHLTFSSNTGTFTANIVGVATLPDADKFRLVEIGEFYNGANATNAAGISWPASRFYTPYFPGPLATSGTVGYSGMSPLIASKGYTEYSLNYTNRNSSRIVTIYGWQ